MEGGQSGGGWSSSTFGRALVLSLVVFDLLIIALAGLTLSRSRQQFVERAEAVTHNLAQVLEQNLKGQVHQVDLILLAVKDEAERRDFPNSGGRIEASILTQYARASTLEALRVVDAQGFISHGTGARADQKISVGDRDYFLHLKNHPEAGLFISRPTLGRVTGKWVLILARRLNQPDGGFAGLVYGSITLEEISRGLGQLDVGPHGSISLRGGDLSLLARYPAFAGEDKLIGDRTISGDYLQAVRSNRFITHFTTRSILDGSARTYTMRKMANPPFYILVGMSQQDYLKAWRDDALLAGLAVSGLLVLSALIGWMARSAWRRQLADKALLAQEEEKYRMLAENALDVIWTSDPEGRLTYVSPSALRQDGFMPPEIGGDSAPLGRLQDQLLARLARVALLPPGSQPFEQEVLELALPTAGGPPLQAEVRVRVLWGHDGRLQGFQGVTRDITERKGIEAERNRLIQELTDALAEVKNLEGLLPICSYCKKIRDDQGYWNHIEAYLSEHTDARFTHGMCPDCLDRMRQDMRDRR